MFERYTEKARRVIFYARYEASEFGSPAIDTEHLLLALLREDKVHLHLFLPLLASTEPIRAQIEARTPKNEVIPTSVDLPLSDECKRVLAYAAEGANRLGHKHIGPEHLFLGLLRETKCFAAQMLRERGADLKRIRKELAATPPQPPSRQEEAEAGAALCRLLVQSHASQPPQVQPSTEHPSPAKTVGFQGYTESGRRAIFLARDEAAQLGSPYIESEHLLLGLLQVDSSLTSRFLKPEASQRSFRDEIEANTAIREKVPADASLPLSNESKRALAYGAEEAERLSSAHIGVEHLLLGLLREEGCFAAQMLLERGAELDRIRKLLADPPHDPTAE